MTIEKIIQKAIEGGYEEPRSIRNKPLNLPYEVTFLDPSFWQSLGKALKWAKQHDVEWDDDGIQYIPEYIYHWHRFIAHLAEGKNAESFFETFKVETN